MAGRAEQLRDVGVNASSNWDFPFGTGQVHIGAYRLQRHSGKVAPHRRRCARAGDRLLRRHDHPHAGLRGAAGQPQSVRLQRRHRPARIAGSEVAPLPGQGQPIKAGEFILGYPGEADLAYPIPQPDVLGRNGTYVGFRKYQSRVGTFNRFLQANASTQEERELLAAKLVGRWRSGAPLTLAPHADDPALGEDPQAQQRLQLFGRRAGTAGTVRLSHAPHEPARFASSRS